MTKKYILSKGESYENCLKLANRGKIIAKSNMKGLFCSMANKVEIRNVKNIC